jgi:hypothetical protein
MLRDFLIQYGLEDVVFEIFNFQFSEKKWHFLLRLQLITAYLRTYNRHIEYVGIFVLRTLLSRMRRENQYARMNGKTQHYNVKFITLPDYSCPLRPGKSAGTDD